MRQITNKIYYTGVNDRVTDRFEGLWPLPNGVSYNSYLVKGEKIALIDCVEVGYVENLLHILRDADDVEKVDYVVVNHIEPDHSGGLPSLLKTFPEMKVIGNKQTIGMLKGFYKIADNRFVEVTDGEILDLGGVTLQFYLTPMVHWPETMMTYCKEEKVLFSGDAFGCFGALNGGIVDEEMDCSHYIPEMYRYYSNIVGKYGKFVQRAIAKVGSLEFDYICSTHGPVWHERISEVVEIYNQLSSYRSESGATIIYGSMYGNTAEVAEQIAEALTRRGIKKINIHNASKSSLSDMISDAFRYKILIVGAPTYSMRIYPPVEQFMIAMETREVKDKVFATFSSHTWASAASKKLMEYTERLGFEHFGHVEIKQSSNETTPEQIERLAEAVANAVK